MILKLLLDLEKGGGGRSPHQVSCLMLGEMTICSLNLQLVVVRTAVMTT